MCTHVGALLLHQDSPKAQYSRKKKNHSTAERTHYLVAPYHKNQIARIPEQALTTKNARRWHSPGIVPRSLCCDPQDTNTQHSRIASQGSLQSLAKFHTCLYLSARAYTVTGGTILHNWHLSTVGGIQAMFLLPMQCWFANPLVSSCNTSFSINGPPRVANAHNTPPMVMHKRWELLR